jgi:hypothetical protein
MSSVQTRDASLSSGIVMTLLAAHIWERSPALAWLLGMPWPAIWRMSCPTDASSQPMIPNSGDAQ